MSNGFERAQAAYDAAEPPSYEPVGECYGDGTDIFAGDQVCVFLIKEGPDVMVVEDIDHLKDALKRALGAVSHITEDAGDAVTWMTR